MTIKKGFIYLVFVLGVIGCSFPNKNNFESETITSILSANESYADSSPLIISCFEDNSATQASSSSRLLDEHFSSNDPDTNSSKDPISFKWELCVDMQDGCVYNNYLFLFNSTASCSIYNLLDNTLISSADLPDFNGWLPHSNSVFFGKKFVDSDPFPLLYTNIYNNYAFDKSTFGMCFVYRIFFDESFRFEIIQTIKVGFADDAFVWYNNSNNSDPFGNFFINNDDLWIYVSISGSSITRFFKTKLPEVNCDCEGIDARVIVADDIYSTFDIMYFHFLQGNTVFSNKLLSIEGSGRDDAPGYLRIIDLETEHVQSFNLNQLFNGNYEPEFIDIYGEYLLVGFYYWNICFLPLNYFGL